MAARYWVGGTATWDATAGLKWALTDGGAGGQAVPTSADDVFFTAASGAVTCSVSGFQVCKTITCTGFTGTLTATTARLDISGNATFSSGMTFTVLPIQFLASGTLLTNGLGLVSVTIFAVGGTVQMGDALTLSSSIVHSAGTFTTNGYALTASGMFMTVPNTRTVNLGASTVTFTSNTQMFSNINQSLTFNAGTSTVNFQGTGTIDFISSGIIAGLTFYNVTFTSTTARTVSLNGVNTYNNLSFVGPASIGVSSLTFSAGPQTINGTLSVSGTAGNRRVLIGTSSYGIAQTLILNSAPSLSDVDFRGIYVTGTASPISGTRIGNRGECRGINFDAPKTVYWNLAGAQNWSAAGWALTSSGIPSTDNFPLPQDTATFTNAGSVTGTITLDAAIGYVPTVDMSGRTTAMTLAISSATTVYGNWTNGSGTTLSGTSTLTFSGGTTQTITPAGKTFSCPIAVDTYGGEVRLGGALITNSTNITVTNGTFSTQNYSITALQFNSNNSNVRTINLGSSTLSLASSSFATSTNLTLNAGTSTLSYGYASGSALNSGTGLTFYNVVFNSPVAGASYNIDGTATFNNLTIGAPSSNGIITATFSAGQTINGTLTCAGASPTRRVFLRSTISAYILGPRQTLSVGTLSANDCDFRSIAITGAAAGTAPTRAGNCGDNSGITFPAPKTVYWNLAGTQDWTANGWTTTSGGTPSVNDFPLAQDTCAFDNTTPGCSLTISIAYPIGSILATRSALGSGFVGIDYSLEITIYGNLTDSFYSRVGGVGSSGFALVFSGENTQTIASSSSRTLYSSIIISKYSVNGIVQLGADLVAQSSAYGILLYRGTFDAANYNVTTARFSNQSSNNALKMGNGTWTLTGIGTVWDCGLYFPTITPGNSTIVLSSTSTSSRTFAGGGGYYNKLTIGDTTGTSNLIISGANTFGELASTKTVAHTITFPSGNTTTIGKWSVTGTVGNVVTLAPSTAASAYTLFIAGPATSGINYLAISYCTVATNSLGEFYAGANSTNTGGNSGAITFTATPSPRALYWVGGAGNWSSTTKWSTSSGGASGAAIPTSLDSVTFDSASGAASYTATIDAGIPIARCAALSMSGPASGNLSLSGTIGLAIHGTTTVAATGVILSPYSGPISLSGNSAYTFTTNNLSMAAGVSVEGIGSTWTLGSALNLTTKSFGVYRGSFDTGNYALVAGKLDFDLIPKRSVSLGSSTITLGSTGTIVGLGTATTTRETLSFNAGTSQINCTSSAALTLSGNDQTFYNVSFTSAAAVSVTINGTNTFNTLAFAGQTTLGVAAIILAANQTVSTLTLSPGTDARYRNFLRSDTLGTPRTIALSALTAGAADVDFRDIVITGAAAPISGTRFGDCRGNSGITFDAPKTVYWCASSSSWNVSQVWNNVDVFGAGNNIYFPLAQDTAVIGFAAGAGSTVTLNYAYNIGTLDMSLRSVGSTLTFATGIIAPTVYGNWINGNALTLSGTGVVTFSGRGSQTITSAGKTFTQRFSINTPGGSVTLQDAIIFSNTTSSVFDLVAGTFDASSYNLTYSSTGSASFFSTSSTSTRTLAIGSGTWTFNSSGSPFTVSSTTGLSVTGTGTLSFNNSATSKTFAGGGANYSGITINQGGAGTLTITGNNTLKTITNTYGATNATSIALGSTTQTLTSPWTAAGTVGKILTVSGTSAASPANLIYTGAGTGADVGYLSISSVRAYDVFNEWYAGTTSTNGGTLGWYFIAAGGIIYSVSVSENAAASDVISSIASMLATALDTARGTETVEAASLLSGQVSESANGSDQAQSYATFVASVDDVASLSDQAEALSTFNSDIDDSASAFEEVQAQQELFPSVEESAQPQDQVFSQVDFQVNADETASASDDLQVSADFVGAVDETVQLQDQAFAQLDMFPTVDETAQVSDAANADQTFATSVDEAGTAADSASTQIDFGSQVSETATAQDLASALADMASSVSETVLPSDAVAAAATFSGDVADTVRVSDAPSTSATFRTDVSDTVQVSDQESAAVTFGSNISDTVQAFDQIDASAAFSSLFSDTVQASDQALVAPSTFNADTQETATAADQSVARATFESSVADTVAPLDSVLARQRFAASVSDTVAPSDSVSAAQTFRSTLSETATALDQTSVAASVFGASTSETATAKDTTSALVTVFGTITETATARDTTVGFLIFPASVSDSVQAFDLVSAGVIFRATLTEQVTAADTVSPQKTSNASLSETATAQDQALVAPSTFNAALSESSQAVDLPSTQAIFQAQTTEDATGADSTAAALITFGSVAETAQAVEAFLANQTFSANVSDTTGLADVAQAFADFRSTLNESATTSDQVSTVVVFVGSVVEQATVADLAVVSASIFNAALQEQMRAQETVDAPGSIYNPTFAASATAQDVVSPALTIGPSVSESVTAQDTNSAAFTALSQISESATVTDATSGLLVYATLVNESATAADSILVAPSTFNAIALAAATALDNADASGSVFNASLSESVTILDSLIGGFLWTLIDDSQTPNWQGMPAVQVAGWVQVDDTQTTNWQNVPSEQGATWTQIDTDNTPNWQREPPE